MSLANRMAVVVACWEVSDALWRELSQPTRINAKMTTSDVFIKCASSSLTKKAEPPPTRDVNRDSGTASANGGWLRRLVRRRHFPTFSHPLTLNKNGQVSLELPKTVEFVAEKPGRDFKRAKTMFTKMKKRQSGEVIHVA